jgi:hypothetical protein
MANLAVLLQDRQDVFVEGRRISGALNACRENTNGDHAE